MEKYKRADVVGIERENERDENYKSTRNPQIDKSKTSLNYHTVPYEKKYLSFIDERIKQLSPKRKIKDDAVRITSFILGSDKEFFDRITAEQQKQFFADFTEFFSKRYGKENVVSAVVHLDESTPYLHFNLMPVTDGRLCAKELFDRAALRELQTNFYEVVGKKYGLKRGKEGSTAKHLDTVAFKAKKMTEAAEEKIREAEEAQVAAKPVKELLESYESAKSEKIPFSGNNTLIPLLKKANISEFYEGEQHDLVVTILQKTLCTSGTEETRRHELLSALLKENTIIGNGVETFEVVKRIFSNGEGGNVSAKYCRLKTDRF